MLGKCDQVDLLDLAIVTFCLSDYIKMASLQNNRKQFLSISSNILRNLERFKVSPKRYLEEINK
jgi:hypothetical protein